MSILKTVLYFLVYIAGSVIVGGTLYCALFRKSFTDGFSTSFSVMGGGGLIINSQERKLRVFTAFFGLLTSVVFSIFTAFLIRAVLLHQDKIEIINKKKKEMEKLEKMKKGLVVGCDKNSCSIDRSNLEKKIDKKIDEKIDKKIEDAKADAKAEDKKIEDAKTNDKKPDDSKSDDKKK